MPKSLEERVSEGEEGHLEAETEQASEAQEETEPDSGLGESSVEGGKDQSSVHGKYTDEKCDHMIIMKL